MTFSKCKKCDIQTMNLENVQLPHADSSAEIISETPMLPPPQPSTSHFPPSFEQVAPKPIVTQAETTEPSISAGKTPEVPKEKEVSPTNVEEEMSKIEEENTITDLNDKIKEPDVELDVVTGSSKIEEENTITDLNEKIKESDVELDVVTGSDSIGMTNVDELETIQEQKLQPAIENEEVMIEIESAISEMRGLTYAAVEEGKLCQEAIENHSILVEKVLEKAVGDDNDADDGTWKDVFDAANQKTDHLVKAQVSLAPSY